MAKACDILHEGQRVVAGQVIGTLRAVCDPSPLSHFPRAALEVRVADTWIERGRAAVVSSIPDSTGFPVEVRAECRPTRKVVGRPITDVCYGPSTCLRPSIC